MYFYFQALERILNAPKRPGTPYALFLQDKKGEKQPNFAVGCFQFDIK